ncbi:hypothetical protein [Nonomuraea rubra]|uniref:hypothetical protein n=1 Tax=Nonomuraea rubra TaxID=46180 RepID=UPI0033FBB41E
MNGETMKARLDEAGVHPDEYHQYARPLDGFYVVPMALGWAVYYQERGVKFHEKTFMSESAACAYLITLLTGRGR